MYLNFKLINKHGLLPVDIETLQFLTIAGGEDGP